MPANRGQLTLLNSTQQAELVALGPALKVAELVKIYWPSPDGAKVYSWWDCKADATYTTPLNTWLAGAPLIPGFVATDPEKRQRFHDIPRTSAVGDDVIMMRFMNAGQVFEGLCYKHRGGVKVEVFYFFPQLNSGAGLAVSWFLGHLRTPEEVDADFVTVPVANGFRSAQLDVPNRLHSSNCEFYFGGELADAEDLYGNPCPYDRHLGGSVGNLNSGSPYTTCERTESACIARLGNTTYFGGFKPVIDSTLIGNGGRKTVSTTVGNESRLKDPVRVVYGTRRVRALHLLNYAKEYHPDEDEQDSGTIRTLFEVSEGPIKSIENVKVMDRPFPRPGGVAGIEKRLGTQGQSATTYSPSVGNYNRLAHFRADLNPIDPNGVQGVNIVAEADVEGRNTVRIYIDDDTYENFTEEFTNIRAWCFLDLLSDKTYGHKMDVRRFLIEDFAYLEGLGSPFDADVQGRSVQQLVEDVCLAGRWYLPFNHNGYIRVMPIEDVDLSQPDIPHFTDSGTGRNILWDRERNVSRLKVRYQDDDLLPNSVITVIEDADNDNIERPLTFNAIPNQLKEGQLYGDRSKRKVQRQFAAFGLTRVDDVRTLGEMLIKIGPFGTGGLDNNCSIEFAIPAMHPAAINLHENKVIRVTSDKLTPYKDPDGDTFEFFLVTGLQRTPNLELIVRAQAWFYDICVAPGGSQTGIVKWDTPDVDVADGPDGPSTIIVAAATADRSGLGTTWPDTIDPGAITSAYWEHTVTHMPSGGWSYDLKSSGAAFGFKVWYDGSGWVYRNGGVDTAIPPGRIAVGTVLRVEYDYNGGSPRRYYKIDGTTLHTDTTGVDPDNDIKGTTYTAGDTIGSVRWSVTYGGCQSSYYVSPVEQGGQSTTGTGNETGGTFDVIEYQIFDIPDPDLEQEIFR